MNISLQLTAVAVGLAILAGFIVRKQTKAKSCPRHNRTAGRVAMICAGLAAALSIVLLIVAWWNPVW